MGRGGMGRGGMGRVWVGWGYQMGQDGSGSGVAGREAARKDAWDGVGWGEVH